MKISNSRCQGQRSGPGKIAASGTFFGRKDRKRSIRSQKTFQMSPGGEELFPYQLSMKWIWQKSYQKNINFYNSRCNTLITGWGYSNKKKTKTDTTNTHKKNKTKQRPEKKKWQRRIHTTQKIWPQSLIAEYPQRGSNSKESNVNLRCGYTHPGKRHFHGKKKPR